MIDRNASDAVSFLGLQAGARLAHAALEAIIVVNQDQEVVMINPAGLAMFGLSREQALGMRLEQFIPERFRLPHGHHVQRFRHAEEIERPMGSRGNVTGLRSNGEEFPLEAAIFRSEVVHPWGTQVYYTALLRDQSEVRRLASVIEQFNLTLRSLFEHISVAICITEADRVVYANMAGARLLGCSDPSSLLGSSIFDFLSPDSHEAVRNHLRSLRRDDASTMQASVVRRNDGAIYEVELVMAPLPDHERSLMQLVINDVTQRSRERRDLLHSRRALRDLSASIVEAREEERRRIARELHDELGQRLTAMKLEMIACFREHPQSSLAERAQGMLDMLNETVASTRRIAMNLRPPMLDDLGLGEAIEWLVQDFNGRCYIKVELHKRQPLGTIPTRMATTVYRIVQEALTNVSRHSQATRVVVTLEGHDRELRLTIQDNGVGFPPKPQARRANAFGLLGMRERVLMLGGQLTLGNSKEGGALLQARFPIPPLSGGLKREDDLAEATGPFFEASVRGSLDP